MNEATHCATMVGSVAARSADAAPAASAGGACTNCATPLAGRYCHACGQDSVPDETALASWHAQWRRLARTLFALVLRPGLLTREHLTGGRIRYVPPFTLFLNVVAIFFLLSVVTEFRVQSFVRNDSSQTLERAVERRAQRAGVTKDVFLERVDRRFQSVYTLCLASISILGYTLLFKLFYRRRWHDWRGPFTFALHYLAFIFIALGTLMAAMHLLSGAVPAEPLRIIALAASAFCAVSWLALADRRLFGERWPVAVGKGVAIVGVGLVIDNAMALAAVMITFNIA